MNRCALAVGVLLITTNLIHAADTPLILVQTIALKGVDGKLDHLAVDSKNQRLFVANKPNNSLDIVDLKTGTLLRQIPDQGKVSGVAYASDLDMVYVGNGSGVCNGFACSDFRLIFSTKAPGADNVHYHSGTQEIFVAHGEMLSILNAKTGDIKTAIKLPGSIHGFKIDKKGEKVFVVLTKPSAIGVIDLNKNEIVTTYPLTLSDAGSPIAYDSDHSTIFVGCPKKNPMVVVFDAKTGKELAGIKIPGGVDDIHFDSKQGRVYASCGENALVVIEKKNEKYEVVATLETPKFSRTCVYSKGKLYLGVPKQEGKDGPEIRVFEPK
jgi:DNA-binding beta-propeller fold protein YncE